MQCRACDATLPAESHALRRFCSATCQRRWHRRDRIHRHASRVCEVCAADYWPVHSRQRTCGRFCGGLLSRRWPEIVASLVEWKRCSSCDRWYTYRGRRRCACGKSCVDCGAPMHRGPRLYCPPCSAANDRIIRARGRAVRRVRMRTALIERVDPKVVTERDRGRCGLCGKRVDPGNHFPHPMSPTLDHILPISRGGDHSYANVQLAHFACNLQKRAGGSQQLRLIG